jgi:hypothetical protein
MAGTKGIAMTRRRLAGFSLIIVPIGAIAVFEPRIALNIFLLLGAAAVLFMALTLILED